MRSLKLLLLSERGIGADKLRRLRLLRYLRSGGRVVVAETRIVHASAGLHLLGAAVGDPLLSVTQKLLGVCVRFLKLGN